VAILTHSPDGRGWAAFSPMRQHRYVLGRKLVDDENIRDPNKVCTFVMLNPSKADEARDDATVRRCRRYAKDWGYDMLRIMNLYAYVTTYPPELFAVDHDIRVGPENDAYLKVAAGTPGLVVCAWGANLEKDAAQFMKFVQLARDHSKPLHCLGRTKDGHPRHPLRLPASLRPEPFLPEAATSPTPYWR
jgi:hypothetical protein